MHTGSADFTTWLKLIAMRLKLTHADTWPTVWKKATGRSARMSAPSTRGTACSFVTQSSAPQMTLATAGTPSVTPSVTPPVTPSITPSAQHRQRYHDTIQGS